MHQILSHGAQQFNLTLSQVQLDKFEQISQELIAWNQKVNLTRITDPEEIAVKHFLDSLSVYQVLTELPSNFSMIDVGTGAGFPGLPLKIILPDIHLTLLEATGKKTKFLQHMVELLSLTKVIVVTARAEEAGQQVEYRERYDVAVARAVSGLAVLAEYMLPLIKVGGMMIAQKGQDPTDEIKTAAAALHLLGGKVEQIVPVEIPCLEANRHLVLIQKVKPTPKQYPRRPGLPAKNPL